MPKLTALEWLVQLTETGEPLTYISTAALTNLAAFLTAYPERRSSISRVIMMGGWSSQALPEWNIRLDPEAVDIVIGSGLPIITMGYDVTLNCILDQGQLAALSSASHPGARFLHSLYRLWMQETRIAAGIVHDPLTVAYLLDPTLVKTVPTKVRVLCHPGSRYGTLLKDEDQGQEIQLAVSLDRDRYLDLLIRRLAVDKVDTWCSTPRSPVQLEIRSALQITYPAGWRLDSIHTQQHLIGVVLAGKGRLQLEGTARTVGKGMAIYLPAGSSYGLSADSQLVMLLVYFDAWRTNWDGTRQMQERMLPQAVFHFRNDARLPIQVKRIVNCWLNPSPANILESHGVLYEVLAYLEVLEPADRPSRGTQYRLVEQVKAYLNNHVEDKLSLDELSERFLINKFHLIQIFKEIEGTTPMQYYQTLRLHKALTLLELGQLSLREIAENVGYQSPQAFSNAFRKRFGVSPKEYADSIATGTQNPM